eukprot:gene2431-2735_t
MTVPLEQPAWPSGDPGKVLLHFVADGNVDALFEDFFGVYPELQAKLHRQRNDTNVAESPWVASRAQLPQQQFLWPAPPAGADPGVAAPGSCRKVRFEAAPSLASKAFSSEEVQTLLSCSPGSHYLLESEVYTSAMYGDQFCIISRYTLLAKGPGQTHLHLTYAINFKPTLNRLVRPMVAKGVDGLLDVPDNVLEVVASMLLVAVANKLLIMLVELGAAMAKASTAPPASVQPSAVEASQTLAEATLAQPSTAAGTGQAAGAAPAGMPGGLGSRVPSSTPPVPIPARTFGPLPGAAGSAGGSSGGGELLSQVVTGWGKMVDSLSSNEGFKVLLGGLWDGSVSLAEAASGTWLRPDQSVKQGSPEAQSAAVSERLAARASLTSVPSHRHTTSFTAVMDPSGLNIIEDYAQMEAQLLPGMEEVPERSTHSSPAAAPASLLAVADDDDTGGAATAAAVSVADGAAVSPRSHSLPALQSPAGSDPARSRTSSPSRPSSRLSHRVTPAAAAGSNDIVTSPSVNGVQQEPPAEGTMGNGSRSTTPTPSAPAADALASRASSAPPHPPGYEQQQQKSKAVKISQSKEAPERSSSGAFGSSGSRGNAANVLLSRRSASPVVYGELAAASSNSLGSRGGGGSGNKLRGGDLAEASGGSYEALAAAAPYVAPGQEDEDEVLVEVFEHERVQPFRGWGHTWPGHFLPSDKVGHWGDRQGAPGGDASMLFDRVAPKLPAGWAWKDAEWQVDMGDQEVESCDAEGWSYGMDFSWLQWPPPPQSGRAGLKSFVRRRRWVRTRMRLPPGCYEEQLLGQQEAQDSLLAGLSSSGIPLQELTAGLGGRQASSGGGEAGLIAGLGSGLGSGLGLGQHKLLLKVLMLLGCLLEEYDSTDAAASRVKDANRQHEPGLGQPAASVIAAASDTSAPGSTADTFARQVDLNASSAAVSSATDAGAVSQQPGALQTAEPTHCQAAQVGCAAPAISSSAPCGAAGVPVVSAAGQPVESVTGLEIESHTATDTVTTPAAAGTPCEPETRAAGGMGEAVGLYEDQPIQSQGSGGWAWSAAPSPDPAVAAATAPAAAADDVQPVAARSDSVGAEQQQNTTAAGDLSGATASLPGGASKQAGPAAAFASEASSSSLTVGPPRQLRLRAQRSRDASHLGSGGSVTPTVAGTSPSGGSGQRSSTLRPRSSSGSGSSKPGGKKLGAVPLRSSADNSLRSSGSGRLLSPQTSTDGCAEAAEASRGLQADVGIAATAATGSGAALQPPSDTSDVASGSSGSRLSAAITSDTQPNWQQGDAAAANQSGVGTAAGTAALDDPDSVGSSAGLTSVNLIASGSQGTAVHVPAVGMSAADGGANELGSGLTSWAPDADGCIGSSSISNSTTSAIMRSRRGGLGAGVHGAQSRLEKDK